MVIRRWTAERVLTRWGATGHHIGNRGLWLSLQLWLFVLMILLMRRLCELQHISISLFKREIRRPYSTVILDAAILWNGLTTLDLGHGRERGRD